MATLAPLQKTRLHEGIVEQLQEKILSGQFRSGDKLPPERDLAESLDVNRSTLREAFKKLEMLDLVEIRHGDGVYVKDYLDSGSLELLPALMRSGGSYDVTILKGLLDLRRLILPDVAFQAALNRTDGDLAEMERVIGDGSLTLNDRDMLLYRAIGRASRNIPFVIILNFFNNSGLVAELLTLYFADPFNLKRTTRFYGEIVDAIRERRPDKSKKIMYDLLVFAEDKTIRILNEKMNKDGIR
ncbi:MAG TPA: FadR/GntR family transcriptional regulator [Spirochaetota bacterium]|nr:FadR/GntR family transcriptional regulator [Spirochaetota bacterium]HPC41173.1 FadR/GntR family transcriptional regulator [Spirochaetota bacterium]HPL18891.1 FadR/GntR family transcriptional regulator [Spirochaetota bacterium]HQF07093.1 FadR/GntR family transcriptional regulator [Spirochaetota bacterium]HQH95830.1 FadR/GntR family transcriptional regulator [Spirochaetota bacterium]